MENRLFFKHEKKLYEDKKRLISKIDKERTTIGYYTLPKQNIDAILEFADTFDEKIETIVVLGIGGSSLGAKAIYEFLKPMEQLQRELIFFESTDPLNIMNQFKSIKKSYLEQGYLQDTLLKKSLYYARNHTKYHINCIFAYSESLKYFCEWYVQLWGESLGKKQRHSAFNVGLTPIGLIGPKDQHSFLQLIMEGTRDKSVTFIKIEDFQEDLCIIPDITLPHLESLDTLNGLSFSTLINMQCDSVIEALEKEEGIPLDSITLPKMNAHHIGSLIYYYELLTSLVGQLIDVNTYDQPGVEAAKIILKKKLTSI